MKVRHRTQSTVLNAWCKATLFTVQVSLGDEPFQQMPAAQLPTLPPRAQRFDENIQQLAGRHRKQGTDCLLSLNKMFSS